MCLLWTHLFKFDLYFFFPDKCYDQEASRRRRKINRKSFEWTGVKVCQKQQMGGTTNVSWAEMDK